MNESPLSKIVKSWDSLPDEVWALVLGALRITRWRRPGVFPYELRQRDPKDISLKTAAARRVALSITKADVPSFVMALYIYRRGIEFDPD